MVKHSSTGWKTFKIFQLQKGGALAPIEPPPGYGPAFSGTSLTYMETVYPIPKLSKSHKALLIDD